MKEKIVIRTVNNETGEVVARNEFVSEFKGAGLSQAKQSFAQMMGTGKYTSTDPLNTTHLEMFDESVPYNKEDKKKLNVVDREDDRKFGAFIIDVIAAFNKKNFSMAQVQAIFSNPGMIAVTLALLTGALETARAAMAAIGSSLYPPDFVAQVLARMDEQIEKSADEPEDDESVQITDTMPSHDEIPPVPDTNVQAPPEPSLTDEQAMATNGETNDEETDETEVESSEAH